MMTANDERQPKLDRRQQQQLQDHIMFSWSTSTTRRGSSTTRYPASTRIAQPIQGTIRPPDFTRQQHIESYCSDAVLQKSTRKVSTDDSTYDNVFQTTSGEALILRVHVPPLPPNSPSRPPQMSLVGVKATHTWLDSKMRIVGYAPIQSDASWKQARILLGQAVHEVVKHLQLNPPIVLEVTDAGLAKLQSSLGGRNVVSTASVVSNSSVTMQQPPDYDSLLNSMTPPPPVDMPGIPSQYPELDSLSREELQHLLDDDLDFQAFVNQLPVMQEIKVQRSSLLQENAKLATQLLEREEEYKLLHGEVSDLKSSLVPKLKEFEKYQKEQDEFIKPAENLSKIQRELNRARKEVFEESESFAEAWVREGGNVSDFCKEFLEKRMLMHQRAAKLERLQQQGSTSNGYAR